MTLTLFDRIDHLVVVVAAIVALACLVIWGGLSVDVAAPAIVSLAGLSSGAALVGSFRQAPPVTVVQAPLSGGSQTMGAP